MSGDCKVKFVAPSAFTKWSGSTFKLQAATSAVPPASNVDGVLSGNSLLFVIERPVGGNDSEPALEMWRGSCVCAQTRATLDVGEWRRLQQSGRVETYQVPIKCVDALRQVGRSVCRGCAFLTRSLPVHTTKGSTWRKIDSARDHREWQHAGERFMPVDGSAPRCGSEE
jgi:hypothetical protein